MSTYRDKYVMVREDEKQALREAIAKEFGDPHAMTMGAAVRYFAEQATEASGNE